MEETRYGLRVQVAAPFEAVLPRIVGNPTLADRALHADMDVGLLLPCNVIVYEASPSASIVAAMAPLAALGIVGDNPAPQRVAEEADARLRRALNAMEEPGARG